MGWCSATQIFDSVIGEIIDIVPQDVLTRVAVSLGSALQDGDWDCEYDSDYIEDARLKEAWKDLSVDV